MVFNATLTWWKKISFSRTSALIAGLNTINPKMTHFLITNDLGVHEKLAI